MVKLDQIILFSLILTAFAVNCAAADLVITGTLASKGHYSNENILTQGVTTVNSNVEIEFIARETVKFYQGFKIMPGGILKVDSSPDSDTDLILDVVENRTCTVVNNSDTDGDGLSYGYRR